MTETGSRLAAAGQVFKGRRERARAIVARLMKPQAYCRVCGVELGRARLGRSCDECSGWAGAIIRAHESRRIRAYFGDLP